MVSGVWLVHLRTPEIQTTYIFTLHSAALQKCVTSLVLLVQDFLGFHMEVNSGWNENVSAVYPVNDMMAITRLSIHHMMSQYCALWENGNIHLRSCRD